MPTIIAGSPASFTVTVATDGQPVPLSGDVSARVFSKDGRLEYVTARPLMDDAPGADWPAGVVAVTLGEADTASLPPGDAMLVLGGGFGIKRFRLVVETLFAPTRTSLFVKDLVIEDLRRDRLVNAATGVLQAADVSDDYLWDKVRAAESEIAHTLRVPLVPTRFFPEKPTQEQIDALGGMAWGVDPAYDYMADMFKFDKWGYFVTRQRPIISVERLRFAYPTRDGGGTDIPLEWLRIDARYGHVRLIPTSPAVFISGSVFVFSAMTGARNIPSMMQLTYTAGLEDAGAVYPELLDAIKKKAVLKLLADSFLPSSGSISSDGHSESMSVDMAEYHDAVDRIIHGAPGTNGGLMAKIHGIRTLVI